VRGGPDLGAHAEEDVLDLAADLGQQVQAAAVDPDARDRDVDAAHIGEAGAGDPRGGLLMGRIELRAQRVQRQAGLAVADAAQRLRQRRLAAEVAHVHIRELVDRRGGLVRGEGFGFIRGPVHRGDTIQGSNLLRSAERVENAPVGPKGASARRGPGTGAA